MKFLRKEKSYSSKQKHRDYYDFAPAHLALEERPPSAFARITAITITLGVIITFIWAYVGELDINATAIGKLIVSSRTQTIQAYEQGRVVNIYVEDGQWVNTGEPLLVLNTIGVEQDVQRLQTQLLYQQRELVRYQALLSPTPLDSIQYLEGMSEAQKQLTYEHLKIAVWEYESYTRNIKNEMAVNRTNQKGIEKDIIELKKMIKNISLRVDAKDKLYKKSVIGSIELLEQQKEQLTSERELNQRQSELAIFQSQYQTLKEQLTAYKAQMKREWFDKYNDADMALATTRQELFKAQDRDELKTIYAPLDGTVQQLAIHTIGGVVQPAQGLMLIVPDDNVQLAEVKVLNKDSGFIVPNQDVTIKVDSYPYTRYGTIDAKVKHISRDSMEDERLGSVFPAYIELKENHIIVGGKNVTLSPGMSVVAEIKTGKRQVIDYILAPIREYQSEAMREK
ncbi:HlyD family type I secretion periplasmic adaptor subunit [Photobacterium sp. J15]|uniref:HlyD family type I secretion periplasmic adaptor subunit n=1 Tax=Photobacterium sp. J15 TaxID=265901 RepID=UPI0007E4AC74|nr:HlyD family type I secretion periplasmic adaptor subunit [Photobacterium sp. J15]